MRGLVHWLPLACASVLPSILLRIWAWPNPPCAFPGVSEAGAGVHQAPVGEDGGGGEVAGTGAGEEGHDTGDLLGLGQPADGDGGVELAELCRVGNGGLVDRGIHCTGPDPHHQDVVRCQLDPGGAGEHAHAALGQAVGGVARHGPVLVHRGHVDDPAAAALGDHLLGGRIINMTSVHEDWPMPGNTAYCLSKGGMRMLTRTAGVELAPHDILVVGVGPGAVDTPINKATVADPAQLSKLDAAIPIGRLAQPEEIASVVAFLAGGGASYLTATTIFADGGLMHSSPGL